MKKIKKIETHAVRNENERQIVLAQFLGLEEYELDDIEEVYDEVYRFGNQEYYVLTDSEADEMAEKFLQEILDDGGIQIFTSSFFKHIIDNYVDSDWFDEAMYESYISYAYDIENESPNDEKFENRLEEEMAEAGVNNIDDFVEYFCKQWENGIEWYRDNFGDEDFSDIVVKKQLYDEKAVIDAAIEEDGRAHFIASYDGREYEIDYDGEIYYIYRIN